MKNTKRWLLALAVAVTLVLALVGCSDPNNGGTPQETPPEVIPAGFVKVTGGTVTGSDAFTAAYQNYLLFGVFFPGRTVTIDTFYMCDHEVTQAEYVAVMGTNPSYFNGSSGREAAAGEVQEKRPVEQVSWYDMIVYCNKRSIAEGFTPCYTINNSTNPAEWGTVPDTNDNSTWNAVTCNWEANGYRLPTEVCLRKLNGNTPHAVEARFLPINTVARTVSPERCRIMPGITITASMVTNACFMRLKRRMPTRSKSTT